MMKANTIGLYVHIPFCIRKCRYCDFASFPLSDFSFRDKYISALCSEIDSYSGYNFDVSTVFFGGGTPSLLSPEEFTEIISHIKSSFNILPNAEFTLEANPGTLTEERLSACIASGVNRISIGLQSIHENELKKLGRIHNYQDFLNCYDMILKSGIKNINVDLMYGIPEQTKDSFKKTLDAVIALNPTHVSAYGLIIEEGTPFFSERDALPLPSEESECDMYYLAAELLRDAGYSHYEISNYAKPAFQCRHNLTYWQDNEYIGVGLSAYSYFDGRRFGNTRDAAEYISGVRIIDDIRINREDEAFEFAMLGLRLSEGFSLSEYQQRFGTDFLQGRAKIVDRLSKSDYLVVADDRIRLTERGFYVSNSILRELLLGY